VQEEFVVCTSCALALVKPQRSAPFSCATSLPFLAAFVAADLASRPCSRRKRFSRLPKQHFCYIPG
jgi:hypothetical protein